MLSENENEKEIGFNERQFDIKKDRLAKNLAALGQAEERGENVAKLAAEVERDKTSFAGSIQNLNEGYALRNPKTPPVEPLEHFLELFKRNSEIKREARAAAREHEAAELAAKVYEDALRASARPVAPVVLRRFEPTQPARPATCSLQDVIAEVENRINKITREIVALEKPGESGGILGLRRARSLATKASEVARIDSILADLLPPHEKKKKELEELRAEHRQLMAQRSDAKKAAGKS